MFPVEVLVDRLVRRSSVEFALSLPKTTISYHQIFDEGTCLFKTEGIHLNGVLRGDQSDY